MNKKLLSIILVSLFVMFLQAEKISNVDKYIITHTEYKKNGNDYTTYSYSMKKQQLLSEDFDSVYLMIVSPSTRSPGSFAGHSFLVLTKGEDLENSIAINFSGDQVKLDIIGRFVTGSIQGLPGIIDIRPFSQIAEKYTIGQERTLFYYKIDINKESIPLLIDKLYEFKDEKIPFRFFSKNCAAFSLQLIEAALNADFSKDTPVSLVPSYFPVILEKNNLVLESGTFSPPIAKLKNESINISKETIKEKKAFYDEYLTETSFMDDSEQFIPKKDLYDYSTKLDSYMSQSSFGIKNNNSTLGFSLFSNNRYEQVQGPTQSLQVNFFEMNLIFDEQAKIDEYKIFEFSSYPKINYNINYTKKLMVGGERDKEDKLHPLVKGGIGISLGNNNILFDITTDVVVPLSNFGINLSLNSEVIFYNKIAYIMLEGNFPYYEVNLDKDYSLKSKAGVTLFDRINLNGSYSWFDHDFDATISWNFNPFYIG